MQCTLAKMYDATKHDITGWLMSEKLDGVRAIWTGTELLTRTLKPIHAPQWFINQLPANVILDGELWIDRKTFQTLVGIVRKKVPIDSEWDQVVYRVFDTPSVIDNYHGRYNRLTLLANDIIVPVPYEVCRSVEHMHQYYDNLRALKAEGVMIRNPDAAYEYKRTSNLLKVKPCRSEEAIVVGYLAGEGKHTGRLGALQCIWNGVEFDVGTGFSDAQREDPPNIGDTITFEFTELTDGGKPRHPVYIGVRDYE